MVLVAMHNLLSAVRFRRVPVNSDWRNISAPSSLDKSYPERFSR